MNTTLKAWLTAQLNKSKQDSEELRLIIHTSDKQSVSLRLESVETDFLFVKRGSGEDPSVLMLDKIVMIDRVRA